MNKVEKQVIKLQLDKEQAAINDLERQYKQALRDIEERIKLLQADELTQSRIYQIQYQKALRGQVEGILDKLHGDEYATIQQYLHDSYQDGFIGTMYSVHGQGIPLILPIDQNAAVKAVITDSQIQEGLYNHLGVNIKQLKQAIRQEITRGLAANMPFADIARNISNRSKAPLSRAKTIVRTEGHRIQQASANDAREAAKANGCDVVKQWDGTLDSDTRPTHRRLDGQIRETNEPFEMDGKKAMYPGDFGKAEEDCNCRCVALTRAKWALDADELKVLKDRAAYWKLDKKDDFKTFEEKYLKAAEKHPKKIETRTQAENALNDNGFALVGHGVEFMPDDQVIVAAKRLQELEVRFGCAKDGSYSLEAPVITGKDKKTIAYVRSTKTTGNQLVLNAEYYSKSVAMFTKNGRGMISSGYHMPCSEEHIKHYTITHEYGHMLEAMMYKKRYGVSVTELDWEKRRAIVGKFEKEVWLEIVEIAKEKNPDFKVKKTTISEYGRTDYAEAFAETFANALCGEPNELGDAMNVWLERNGF